MHWCEKSVTKPLLSSAERGERGKRKRRRHSSKPTRNNNNSLNNYQTADQDGGVELRQFPRSTGDRGGGSTSEDDDCGSDAEEGNLSPAQKAKMVLERISLLLWKNLLFRQRHYIVTALEVILPTLLAMLIAYMRTFAPGGISVDLNQNTTYDVVTEEMALSRAAFVLSGSRFDTRAGCILAFIPNNPLTSGLMEKVKGRLPKATFDLKGFSTEAEIEIFMAEMKINNSGSGSYEWDEVKIKTVVVFPEDLISDAFPPGYQISYKIRLVDIHELSMTNQLFPQFQFPGPSLGNVENYKTVGFTGLQIAIDKTLIEILTGKEPIQTMNTQAFPYPPYTQSIDFKMIYFIVLPQLMVLGFIFIVPSIIRNVVSEKETGIKELMKMMGLPNWMHWLGWMLNSLLILSLSITIVTLLFFIPFDPEKGAVMVYSDPSLWWFVLFLYSMAATSFCFLISTFFRRPTMGTTVGIVLWLVTYYVPVQTMEPKYQFLSLSEKLGSALLPNVALHWVMKVICGFEGKSVGSKWSNIAEPVSSTDELSVGYGCLMLILDTIIYITLTIYFEDVIPSEFGIRKPWYYPFTATTWRREPTSRVTSVQCQDNEDRRGFEGEPIGLRAGVVIHNLKKKFGRNKVAVDMVGTLKMYDGQITALLGHNGAGKTTTLSMLTGLFSPSSGTATVNGFDITTSMDSVRKNLGLCPQHNMLFDKLTVAEHLIFFGRLKGLNKSQARNEMKILLTKLQLSEKMDSLAGNISGGQKRKLSLGIALIGGTKVVVLDEPTSGMDPEARRGIWDLLLEMRGERTIILTTHFMEEADVLGDRIAIMADGKVKCCGSPMFLKKYYGAGYTLKMTVEDSEIVGSLLRIIQNHVPTAFIKTGRNPNSTEVSITIPNEISTNAEFPRLFTTLSDQKGELGILTLGLSLATMDEIFVKVGEDNVHDELDKTRNFEPEMMNAVENKDKATDGLCNGERVAGLRLTFRQFDGLFRKRMLYTFRKRKLFISQFLMPLLLLIACILLSNTSFSPATTSPPLKMDLAVYKNPVTLFRASEQNLGTAYVKTVGSSAVSATGNLTEELLRIGMKDIGAFRERYIVAGDLNDSSVTAMFSSIPYHASPLSVNLMSNTILGSMQGSKGHSIHVTSHPLQSGLATLLEPANPNPIFSTVIPILFGVLLPLGLANFAASFVVFPVEEKLCKVKQLQMMTGVSPIVYWGSSFLWDFCVMFLLICLMVTCFPIFQNYGAFTAYHGGGVIFLIFLFYGFSAISFSYLCSSFVSTVPGGFSLVTIIHIITGMILSLVVYLLETTGLADKVGHVRNVGRLFPTFGASVSMMRFTSIATKNSRCNILTEAVKNIICNPSINIQPEFRQCCPNCASFKTTEGPVACFESQPYITWNYILDSKYLLTDGGSSVPGIGQDLLYLFLIGLLYKVLLLVAEYGLFGRILALIFKTNSAIFQERKPEDEDVLLENRRVTGMVTTGRVSEDALVVDNFCKSYGSFAAVSGLSFGVHHGECFGLLGVNGAGKTTSFRMLTGDEFRSSGNAFGNRLTLEANRAKFLSLIGYCPQFDGIIGVLTGREMLQLFCRLRGVPSAEADKWLKKLGLLEAGDVQCQKYSGGMKRRLCAAIALVGDPPIILLDEPTSGVDPIARRQFWKVISSVRDAGQAIVLTSHSMEECEALCSRLGIMVNGQFQCLGGVQHLKNKYAQGFRLVVKLKMTSADEIILTNLSEEIQMRFSPCTLKDKHQNILEYQVTNTEISWGQIFQSMEDLRAEYPEVIEDYSVSETTLEEVFLAFARKQYEGRDVNISCFKKLVTCHCCK